MIEALNEFALNILRGINSVVGNYGWSVVLFTVLIRLILTPFDVKSRISMRKMALVQPKLQELQKKYAKDQNKLNQKMSELYRKEHVSPFSGCLPMLLSYPILIWMFAAMRAFANEQVARQVAEILQHPETMPVFDGWLWVKNLWMTDSPFTSAFVDLNTMRQVPWEIWTKTFTQDVLQSVTVAYPELATLTVESFSKDAVAQTIPVLYNALTSTQVYAQNAGAVPGWTINVLIASFSLMKTYNGLFLLPALAVVSQLLVTKLTGNQQQPQPQTQGNDQSQQMGNFMKWFFPLLTLWFCASSNAAFALYWLTSNLIMTASTALINYFLDKKEKQNVIAGEGVVQ